MAECEKDPDKVSEIIFNLLDSPKPCMIARFGSTELTCIVNYLGITNQHRSVFRYIKGKQPQWWWNSNIMNQMQRWSGFFPPTEENLTKFCEMMLEDLKEVDILGSWLDKEKFLDIPFKKVLKHYFEPFYSKTPWTRYLENKKVLVIHPYESTIKEQYKKREFLFSNPMILPNFELKTIRAVQSLGGECEFDNWFDSLDYMKAEIEKVEFDVCLIGCGAYGFPLAAHVKRMGKKAIHIGGPLQLFFGIRGKRWDLIGNEYSLLVNNYWCRPLSEDISSQLDNVEDGCYL